MRLLLVSLGLLGYVALAGCGIVITEKVVLRHPENRHTVECGPYFKGGMSSPAQIGAEYALAECVRSYERQGYLRVGREVTDSGPTEPPIDSESAFGRSTDALQLDSYAEQLSQEDRQSLDLIKVRAQQGDVRSQVFLGITYFGGQEVSQDYTAAFYWFRKAAEQGDPTAQAALGGLYLEGLGTQKDVAKAVRSLKRATQQGHGGAQAALAELYWHGNGVPKDRRKAMEMFRQAAERGVPLAQVRLSFQYLMDYIDSRTGGPEKALHWLYKAANQGYGPAQHLLGTWFSTHMKLLGGPVDLVEAYKWYIISGAHGAGKAHEDMARLEKVMTPKQIREAQRLALKWMAEENQRNLLDQVRGAQIE